MKNSKLFEVIYMVLAIAYLIFPIRWAAWIYNFYVLCQMLYHWNDADSWFYIAKFVSVWILTMAWIFFVMFNAEKMKG